MTTATLRAVGNSVAVVIPKQWLTVLNLEAGSKVELAIEGEQLTLKPQAKRQRKKYQLSDLLAQCDPNAPYPDGLQTWDNTAPFGRETW